MKTMTCKQLGGPCEFAHHGSSCDEVIKAQDSHLKAMVASGDATHEGALKEKRVGGSTQSPACRGIGRSSVILPRFPTTKAEQQA